MARLGRVDERLHPRDESALAGHARDGVGLDRARADRVVSALVENDEPGCSDTGLEGDRRP